MFHVKESYASRSKANLGIKELRMMYMHLLLTTARVTFGKKIGTPECHQAVTFSSAQLIEK
jgi:hypothetical protein